MAYTISNVHTTDGAKANGVDSNSISFSLMNGEEYSKEKVVKISLNGDALFTDNNSASIELTTDTLGAASATFTDITAETVTISMVMKDDESVKENATVNFMKVGQQVSSIFMLMQENDAKADGADANIVALQAFDADNTPITSVEIGVSLSNGAVFQDGSQITKIVTSYDDGTTSLSFTNFNVGITTVTAYVPNNLSISNEIDSNFNEIKPVLSTTLAVTTNGVVANGKAFNQVEATVLNKKTNNPESGVSVVFTVSNGSATFIDGAKTFTNTSDADGKVYARLISQTAGSSNILSETYTGASNSEYVDFTEDYSQLEIVRIYNNVKSFTEAGPTTAWPNATFYIQASGGSGDFTWSVDNQSDITYESQDDQVAIFVFTSNAGPNKTYTITVTDNVTNVTTSHIFTLEVFFSSFGSWGSYNLFHKDQYPSLGELTSLYNEWGDMSKYPEWLITNGYHYWTNTEELTFASAVNLKTGKVDVFTILLTLCGIAVKKK